MSRRVLLHAVLASTAVGLAAVLVVSATASTGRPRSPSGPPAWNVHAAARGRVVPPLVDPSGPPRGAPVPRLDPLDREALVYVAPDGERVTAARIAAFLGRHGSPLAPYADVFVEAGVEHDVDPRLVVAISGIESQFGERQIGYNAWGWGIYGDRVRRFPDWATAIRTYTAELAARYDTEDLDTAFARRYCPPNWEHWYGAVSSFFAAI